MHTDLNPYQSTKNEKILAQFFYQTTYWRTIEKFYKFLTVMPQK